MLKQNKQTTATKEQTNKNKTQNKPKGNKIKAIVKSTEFLVWEEFFHSNCDDSVTAAK